MSQPPPRPEGDSAGRGAGWMALDDCLAAAPEALHGWLAEPGLLTARVQRAGGDRVRFTLLRLAPAPIDAALGPPPSRSRDFLSA